MYNSLIHVTFEENLIVISEFLDGVVTRYDLKKCIEKFPVFQELLKDNDLYVNGHIPPGGAGLIFSDEIDIAAEELYYGGTIIRRNPADPKTAIAVMVTMARMKKGVSQKELAELTGIHQAEISKIERGIGNPSVHTLDRIAKGLGLSLKLFLE